MVAQAGRDTSAEGEKDIAVVAGVASLVVEEEDIVDVEEVEDVEAVVVGVVEVEEAAEVDLFLRNDHSSSLC